jgi:hypothetical protein
MQYINNNKNQTVPESIDGQLLSCRCPGGVWRFFWLRGRRRERKAGATKDGEGGQSRRKAVMDLIGASEVQLSNEWMAAK